MKLVRYDRQLKRTWVGGKRLHHGLVGALLIVVGALLVYDDRKDAPWLRDC